MKKLLLGFTVLGLMPIFVASDEAEEHFEQGVKYADERKSDAAVQEFEQAIQANPNHAEAHCMLGIEIYKQAVQNRDEGQLRQAIQELEMAIKIKPDLGMAHDVVAFAYYILGEFEKSQQHHLEAKKLGLPNPGLEKKLSKSFEMLKKQKEMDLQEQ